MKIIHIINSLEKGGAEGNLYRLCQFQKKKYKNKIDITIISLINHGYYEVELKKQNIKTFSLGLNKKIKFFFLIKKIFELRKFIKNKNPDIIQSWMYHSNFITLFVPQKFYNRIFWNIRHSKLNIQISKKITIFISLICGLFSKIVPNKIIYCSEDSVNFHENQHFYAKNKTRLIDNGYSEKSYYPTKSLRLNFRKKNKLKKNDIILGFAGRFAKQKNIPSLLLAFSKIAKNYNNIYLFMAGKDINSSNKELNKLAIDLKITNKVFFLNEQKSLLEFYNGIDLLILTSLSESFPNVVAEAMLCSTPVLSSDVGCSKKIIEDSGFLINGNNHQSIVKSLNESLYIFKNKKKEWKFIKKNCRSKIKNNYSIENMSNIYLENWFFK